MSAMLSGRHWPFAAVVAFVFAAAACIGFVNGLAAFHFRVSPLIVTLATGAMVTGLTLGWTRGGQVTGQVPAWLSKFSSPTGSLLGIGVPTCARRLGRHHDRVHRCPPPDCHRSPSVRDRGKRSRRQTGGRRHRADVDRRFRRQRVGGSSRWDSSDGLYRHRPSRSRRSVPLRKLGRGDRRRHVPRRCARRLSPHGDWCTHSHVDRTFCWWATEPVSRRRRS